MRGLFVTGTDTGVGKTEVAAAIVAGWRARGLDVGAMKAAQSGVEDGTPSDADRLREAAGGGDPAELVCPYTLAAPLAPAVAARLAGVEITLDRMLACAAELARRHAAVVVEGAGGLLVPLAEGYTCADLAVALRLPVLVVARAGLGTVNHTALTCEALRVRGLAVAGVVLNRVVAVADPSEPYNAAEIERLADVRVIATLPHEPDPRIRARLLADRLVPAVQF